MTGEKEVILVPGNFLAFGLWKFLNFIQSILQKYEVLVAQGMLSEPPRETIL